MPLLISDVVSSGSLNGQPQPTLTAEGGLVLRPWRDEDAPAVHRAFQDPLLHTWHARSSDSVSEAARWITQWRAGWADETSASWAVSDAESGALAGRVALRTLSLSDGVAEVAYWTLPEARGRQVAPRALRALTQWAFDVLGLHRLELLHATTNEGSCRVAAKTGFALEGTKRSSQLHGDGWHDMHLHARIAGD